MIPGKKYAPEDYLKIAWRRKWYLIVPLVIASIGTFVWSMTLPNVYSSQATVLIIPPQVPANIVRPTVTESLQERLDLMRQEILSRPQLERIIQEFDLYREERKTQLMDQIVERMRRDIGVNVPKVGRRQDPGHFWVSYRSHDPQLAMRVAERLAALFVRQNLEGRGMQVDSITTFLQTEVADALRKLQEHEARLAQFRTANAGRLPDQVNTNLQMMQNAQQEVRALTDSINRERDRQMTLERSIADETALAGSIVPQRPAPDPEGTPLPAAQELVTAQAQLAGLRLRFTEDHPDVKLLKSRIATLEKKAQDEALQQPVTGGPTRGPMTPAEADRQRRILAMRAEIDSLERNIQLNRQKLERAQATIAQYQQRVEAAPMLETQLSELMRDYAIHQASYEELLRKGEAAKLSANLEQRQVGEQFRIIDPARRPERPTGPDRVRMNLLGAGAGLGLGLLIAGLLEYRDTSLRTQEDVLVALSLPVLALVPTMRTTRDVNRARQRRNWMIGLSTAALLLVALAAVAWRLQLFEGWGR